LHGILASGGDALLPFLPGDKPVAGLARPGLGCWNYLEAPYSGGKAHNLRSDVVGLRAFHLALCAADPRAAELITFGERQLAIAYDLDDSALQRDLGPMPHTPLAEGVRLTLEHFRWLRDEGRLDVGELEA
jgi:hypothetical protein